MIAFIQYCAWEFLYTNDVYYHWQSETSSIFLWKILKKKTKLKKMKKKFKKLLYSFSLIWIFTLNDTRLWKCNKAYSSTPCPFSLVEFFIVLLLLVGGASSYGGRKCSIRTFLKITLFIFGSESKVPDSPL